MSQDFSLALFPQVTIAAETDLVTFSWWDTIESKWRTKNIEISNLVSARVPFKTAAALVSALEGLDAGSRLSYNFLDDLPVLFSGDYADLSNKPLIPSYLINESVITGAITISNSAHGKLYPCDGTFSQALPSSGINSGVQFYFDNYGTGAVTLTGTMIITKNLVNKTVNSVKIHGLCYLRYIGSGTWRLTGQFSGEVEI